MKKKIHVNSLGYMKGIPKTAVCCVNAGIFYVVDAVKGVNVYAGRLSHPFFDRESGDMVRMADFSDFNTAGNYYIRAGIRRSRIFEISDCPYKEVRKEVLHGIYLNRCGYDFKKDTVPGRTSVPRSKCHGEELISDTSVIRTAGGWHSGGGYSKDLFRACLTLADMLYALNLFSESFAPDEKLLLTDECRWGLDWVIKMQDEDGGVFDGIYVRREWGAMMPDEDDCSFIKGEKSCCATLALTAAAALGARYFSDIDKGYSHKLSHTAEKSWLWIAQQDSFEEFINSRDSKENELETGFMWAVCEMYALTLSESFSEMINKKYPSSDFSDFGNGSCDGFAALSYLLSDIKRDRTVEAMIRKRLTDRADRMWIADRESGYRTARAAGGGFIFGSNFRILADCMTFITAYLISGENNYLTGATDQFSYVFGENPNDVAFITGDSGIRCKNPSHRLSAALGKNGIVSGMIVAGANEQVSDDYSKWHIERGTPPAKCYIDDPYSESTNVPAIHFSAPVIFISAFYDKVGRSSLSGIRKDNS